MKFCAIICEYNPLHVMHKVHMELAKQRSGCDRLVCLMSGNYVQRGQPAIFDKYTRAKHAILAGADIVIELPMLSAVSAADDFAAGAMRILGQADVQALSFGCECGEGELLKSCAEAMQTSDFEIAVKNNLDSGMSYPAAVGKASEQLGESLLSEPNNLLGVAYIKEGMKLGYCPEIIAVKREQSYNAGEIADGISSKAIRAAAKESRDYSSVVPDFVLLDKEKALFEESFFDLAHKFVQLADAKELKEIYGVTEGLENRMLALRMPTESEFFNALKTKRYSHSRLRRILFNCVFGITDEMVAEYKSAKPYTRLLGVRRGAEDALGRFSTLFEAEIPESVVNCERKADRLYETLCGRIIRNYPQKL